MAHASKANLLTGLALLFAGFGLLQADRAWAAEPSATDRSVADALFRAGRALMVDKKFKEACAKFTESQHLDPAPGTLLNLGVCHLEEGRFATAWLELNQVLDISRHDGNTSRQNAAREKLAVLEARLSRVTIEVPDSARVPGLEVRLDGSIISQAAWGVSMPVDPGQHEIVATAAGNLPWRTSLLVGTNAPEDRKVILPSATVHPVGSTATTTASSSVPPAVPPDPVPPTRITATKANSPGVRSSEPLLTTSPASSPVEQSAPQQWRTASYVVGGVGLAAIGVGAVFGIRTFQKKSDEEAHCSTQSRVCDLAAAQSDYNSARTSARTADAAFGVGLAAAATSVVLWLRSRSGAVSSLSGTTSLALQPIKNGGALRFGITW